MVRNMSLGVKENTYVDINGMRQYISICGKNANAPIVLNLHGGPANPDAFMLYEFVEKLTNDYVFVCWDQRGCGRTYYENRKFDSNNDTVSFEQALEDVDKLVDYLCKRFRKEKIIIIGHSYGSILGVKYIYKHPEKVLHYIGIGQSVSLLETQKKNYQEVMKLPNLKPKKAKKISKVYQSLMGQATIENITKFQRLVLPIFQKNMKGLKQCNQIKLIVCSPEFSFRDFKWLLGMLNMKKHIARNRKLMDYIVTLDIREKELDFIVPMTFISGAHDKNCNVELVKEYCQKIHANSKRVVVLDNHGHSPHIVEPVLVAETIMEVINEI